MKSGKLYTKEITTPGYVANVPLTDFNTVLPTFKTKEPAEYSNVALFYNGAGEYLGWIPFSTFRKSMKSDEKWTKLKNGDYTYTVTLENPPPNGTTLLVLSRSSISKTT